MSIALHQAEALQGCIGKAVHLWTHRIVDRPPNSFSSAGTNGKAIGIVNFRPPVLFGPFPLWVEVALTIPEHTGLRRNTQPLDGIARSEERRVGKEWVSTCRSRW